MKRMAVFVLMAAMLLGSLVLPAFAEETEAHVTDAVVTGGGKAGFTGETVSMQVWIDRVSVDGVSGYKSFVIVAQYNAEVLEVTGVQGNVFADTSTPGIVVASYSGSDLVVLGPIDYSFAIDFKILGGSGEYPVTLTVQELYGDQDIPVVPSYVREGHVIVTCLHSETETVEENLVEPGCTQDGSYDVVVRCKDCGEEYSRETKVLAATGIHVPADAVRENEKPATCAEAGSYDEVVYCVSCDAELSRTSQTIPATGEHTAEVISGKDATCTETGLTEGSKCAVCGGILKAQEVVEKREHTPETLPAKEATCAETGLTEGSQCAVCEEILVAQQETEKLPHKEAYTCNDDGTHDVLCEICEATLQENEKCFDADPEDDECDGCGYEFPEESTTPTTKPSVDDDDDVPKTGDITPYPAYFLMAVLAVVAVSYGLKRKFDF